MKTTSEFPARAAPVLPALEYVSAHGDGSLLPVPIKGCNLSLNNPVIWWMSALFLSAAM